MTSTIQNSQGHQEQGKSETGQLNVMRYPGWAPGRDKSH